MVFLSSQCSKKKTDQFQFSQINDLLEVLTFIRHLSDYLGPRSRERLIEKILRKVRSAVVWCQIISYFHYYLNLLVSALIVSL